MNSYYEFRDSLADEYRDHQMWWRVASELQIEPISIKFNGVSQDAWANILQRVRTLRKFDLLRGLVERECSHLLVLADRYFSDVREAALSAAEHAVALRLRIGDTRAQERFKTVFNEFKAKTATLAACKNLHDILHRLRLQQYSILRKTALATPWDDDSIAILTNARYAIQAAATSASGILDGWPGDNAYANGAAIWVEALNKAHEDIGNALDIANNTTFPAELERSAALCLSAVGTVQQIIRTQPAVLNNQLEWLANDLPLESLIGSLQGILGDETENAGELLQTLDWMQRWLKPAVENSIAEHGAWQDLEGNLFELERQLNGGGGEVSTEFKVIWRSFKTSLENVCKAESHERIEVEISKYAAIIDQNLNSENISPLYSAFRSCRASIAQRFYLVDLGLKKECDGILPASMPIHELIQSFDDAAI